MNTTCLTIENMDVKIEQDETSKLFTITYGFQVKSSTSYVQAAQEFGYCVFHALACEGLLDNTGGE